MFQTSRTILAGLAVTAALAVALPASAKTDFALARKYGLSLGTNSYSDDVRSFFAELDQTYDKQDYLTLALLTRNPSGPDRALGELDWEEGNMMMGANLIVPILYAETLWSVGSSAPDNTPYAEMKNTAVMVVLYSMAVTFADGPKCADQAAVDHHWTALLAHFKPVLTYAGHLPESDRAKLADTALRLEAEKAELRGNDRYLCRLGSQTVTFTDPAIWRPGQEKMRATARTTILQTLDALAKAPPADK